MYILLCGEDKEIVRETTNESMSEKANRVLKSFWRITGGLGEE